MILMAPAEVLVSDALDAEVYNYAISGTGTDQHVLIFEHLAGSVQADLIVVCVFIENIERLLCNERLYVERGSGQHRFLPKPYFELDGDRLVPRNIPVPVERRIAEPRASMLSGLP